LFSHAEVQLLLFSCSAADQGRIHAADRAVVRAVVREVRAASLGAEAGVDHEVLTAHVPNRPTPNDVGVAVVGYWPDGRPSAWIVVFMYMIASRLLRIFLREVFCSLLAVVNEN
jgi:hypothetical protein